MINIITIPGGIIWRDQNRFFANEEFPKGYSIIGGSQFFIEFQNGITLFDYTEMTINDNLYNSVEEFITAIGL